MLSDFTEFRDKPHTGRPRVTLTKVQAQVPLPSLVALPIPNGFKHMLAWKVLGVYHLFSSTLPMRGYIDAVPGTVRSRFPKYVSCHNPVRYFFKPHEAAFLSLSCLGRWRENHFRLIEISTPHSAANHGADDHLGFIDINTSPEDLSHSHRSFPRYPGGGAFGQSWNQRCNNLRSAGKLYRLSSTVNRGGCSYTQCFKPNRVLYDGRGKFPDEYTDVAIYSRRQAWRCHPNAISGISTRSFLSFPCLEARLLTVDLSIRSDDTGLRNS